MNDENRQSDQQSRIANIALDEQSVVCRSPDIEHERAVAVYDLLEENYFAPAGDYEGPFNLQIRIAEDRLQLDICNEADELFDTVGISLVPFRRIVKDYFSVCESYFEAIKVASPSRIEAIDMGRRGLHNEGSELLRDRLDGKIDIDFDTARRIFTLICVLHVRG